METEEWGFDQNKPNDVTLKELTFLCKMMKGYRESKKEAEDKVKEITKRLRDVEHKVLNYLEEYGMKNFSSEYGTVIRSKRYSVRQPQTPENREAFFGYLKEQGVFDELISVNSRTLTSWVRQEIEAKKDEGDCDFVPPGLDKPEITEQISLRKPTHG